MKTDLTDSSETRSGLHTPSIGRRPTLAVRIGLFVVFTLALVAATYLLLPTLVVIGPWGYVAGFVINLLTNATVMLPAPGFAAVIVMAKELDPFLLGLTAGLGGALGELSGFWLGSQGRDLVRANLIYRIARVYMGRYGGAVIFVAALIPVLPADIAGLIAGSTGYPIRKFLVYVSLGKAIMTITILYLASRAFEWAEPVLGLVD